MVRPRPGRGGIQEHGAVRDRGDDVPSPLPRARAGAGAVTLPQSFHALRMNVLSLLPSVRRGPAPVVALFSGSPGEGVSTVTAGLATAFAQADDGRVLVVDAAGPGAGGLAALGPEMPAGVAEAETRAPMRLARRPAAGLDVLTLRAAGGPGAAYTHGEAWEAELTRLREEYETVFVDCGSLHTPVAAFWKPWTDCGLLVIDSRRTSEFRLRQTRRVLELRQIPVHGSVLNKRRFPVPGFLYRIIA